MLREAREAPHEQLRRPDDTPEFDGSQRRPGPPAVRAAARPHLDHDEQVAQAADDVEFAAAGAKIARDDREALLLQVASRKFFRGTAPVEVAGHRAVN